MKKAWMKSKPIKKLLVLALASCLFLQGDIMASADAIMEEADESFEPYIAFGADLTTEEKEKVMELLGVKEEDLENYKVVEITNKDEHTYLDDYMSADVIGTRALSSVLVVKQEADHGIGVDTHNISYCTSGMYCNALVTAGINDAEVVVAGPFAISGTSALVGAMKAYSVMTGEEISEESMDAATNELVVTGELAESLGDAETVESFVARVKERVVSADLKSEEEIAEAIEEVAGEFDIKLSQADKEKMVAMMGKISELDIDVDQLKEQASAVYDKLESLVEDNKGFFAKIGEFFRKIGEAIANFFSSLFG